MLPSNSRKLTTDTRLVMTMKSPAILCLCAVICLCLSSCGVNLAEQYSSLGYRPGIDYKTLASEELPKVYRTEDMIGSLIIYENLGYVSIGRMSFCGKFPDLNELQQFAAEQGAQVVLYRAKENGKIEGTTQALGGLSNPEPAPVLDSYDQEYEFLSKRHDR